MLGMAWPNGWWLQYCTSSRLLTPVDTDTPPMLAHAIQCGKSGRKRNKQGVSTLITFTLPSCFVYLFRLFIYLPQLSSTLSITCISPSLFYNPNIRCHCVVWNPFVSYPVGNDVSGSAGERLGYLVRSQMQTANSWALACLCQRWQHEKEDYDDFSSKICVK